MNNQLLRIGIRKVTAYLQLESVESGFQCLLTHCTAGEPKEYAPLRCIHSMFAGLSLLRAQEKKPVELSDEAKARQEYLKKYAAGGACCRICLAVSEIVQACTALSQSFLDVQRVMAVRRRRKGKRSHQRRHLAASVS